MSDQADPFFIGMVFFKGEPFNVWSRPSKDPTRLLDSAKALDAKNPYPPSFNRVVCELVRYEPEKEKDL